MKRIKTDAEKFELEDEQKIIWHTGSSWQLMKVEKHSPTAVSFERIGFLKPKFSSPDIGLDGEELFSIEQSDFDNFAPADEANNHQPQKKKVLSHRLLNLASRIESLDQLTGAENAGVVMLIQPNQSDMVLRICRTESFGLVTLAAFTEDGIGEAVCLPSEEGKIIQATDINFFSDTYLFKVDPLQGMLSLLRYAVEVSKY